MNDDTCSCWGVDKEIQKLRAELEAAKRENAQLAAAIYTAKEAYDRLYAFHGTTTPPPNLTCDEKECDWCKVGNALDEPSTAFHSLLHDPCETISWALDLIEMYDRRLVQLGDPEHLVYSDTHKDGVWKARDVLARLRELCEKGTK